MSQGPLNGRGCHCKERSDAAVVPLCHCEGPLGPVAISVGATPRPFVIARARQGPWQSPGPEYHLIGISNRMTKRDCFGRTPSFLAMTRESKPCVLPRNDRGWKVLRPSSQYQREGTLLAMTNMGSSISVTLSEFALRNKKTCDKMFTI